MIIMSDHGMTGTGRDSGTTYINLSDYISEDDVEAVIESGTNLTIATAAGKLEEVINNKSHINNRYGKILEILIIIKGCGVINGS